MTVELAAQLAALHSSLHSSLHGVLRTYVLIGRAKIGRASTGGKLELTSLGTSFVDDSLCSSSGHRFKYERKKFTLCMATATTSCCTMYSWLQT